MSLLPDQFVNVHEDSKNRGQEFLYSRIVNSCYGDDELSDIRDRVTVKPQMKNNHKDAEDTDFSL